MDTYLILTLPAISLSCGCAAWMILWALLVVDVVRPVVVWTAPGPLLVVFNVAVGFACPFFVCVIVGTIGRRGIKISFTVGTNSSSDASEIFQEKSKLIQNVPRIIQAMLKWNFIRTFIFSCCDRCGCISRWCARWFSWCGADCRLLCCNWHSRVCFKETIKQKMLKKSPRNKLYLEAQEIFLLLPRIHGDSGALHCPVDKHVMNLGPSGLYPGAQTTSALAPYSVVPLIWTILAFSCTSGNSSHSIGSHLGGGPFHRSSMSHVSIARPIIS